MSMHLVRGMSTISTKKRKGKKKPGWKAKQAAHEKWLTKMGVSDTQLKEKKEKNAGVVLRNIPNYRTDISSVHTSDTIPGGSTAPKERQVYSGERRLLGIATTHKSNMVPVFSRDEAEEISQMRRN